ncbi:MAG: CapA family protein [Bacillota bacterium]
MRRIYFIALLIIMVTASFFGGITVGNSYPPGQVRDFGLEALPSFAGTSEPSANQDQVTGEPEEDPEEDLDPEPQPDLRTIKMVVTGNIMAHIPQIEQAHVEGDRYDFSPSFEIIAPYLQAGDITVADLEGMQAGADIVSTGWGVSGYTGFPEFNAPGELSEALHDAGVDVFTFANNHALDRGYDGLMKTLDHVRRLGAETIGAFKNWEEHNTPLIIEENGINIALIGYTYGTNGIPVPEGHEYCVNLSTEFSDIDPIIEDIITAREYGADLVAVFPHWGGEHSHEPQPQRLRQVAEDLGAAGADLVIGGHPKYVQPIEWFFHEENGTKRPTLAIYSMGNFISNQNEAANDTPFVEFGLLLDVEVTKNNDSDETWISDAGYEITWVHREWRHRVLPLSDVFAASPEEYNLTGAQVERLKSIYDTTIEVVERYGHPEDKARAMAIAEELYNQAYEEGF